MAYQNAAFVNLAHRKASFPLNTKQKSCMTYKAKEILFQDVLGQASPILKLDNVLNYKMIIVERIFYVVKKSISLLVFIPVLTVLRI